MECLVKLRTESALCRNVESVVCGDLKFEKHYAKRTDGSLTSLWFYSALANRTN